MSKAILLNGPASCGKDVAITFLKDEGYDLTIRECKDHLHKLTQLFFKVPESRYWEIYNDRSLKEKPLPEFGIQMDIYEVDYLERVIEKSLKDQYTKSVGLDLSIRQAMIYVSEVICKPRFGDDYFGVARANSIREGELIVDGSTGFPEELPPLIERLGQDNILLIRVYRDGCSFDGDSRNYIPDGVIDNTVDIYNNGSLGGYFNQVEEEVKKFLAR